MLTQMERLVVLLGHFHRFFRAGTIMGAEIEAVDIRMRLGCSFSENPQTVRRNGVIAVHEEHIFATCCLQSGVARTAQALIFLMDHPDQVRMTGCIFIADPGTDAIGAAVVHQNDFTVGCIVGQNRIDAALQILLYIIYGNDDTETHRLFLISPDILSLVPDNRQLPEPPPDRRMHWVGAAHRPCYTHAANSKSAQCPRRQLPV